MIPRLRIPAALLPLLLAVALFSTSLNKGFWGAHGESRRSEVAREVLEEGNWLIPTLNGEAFITKPPLLYWSIASSFALFGVSETAARLPSMLALFISWLAMAGLSSACLRDLGRSPDARSAHSARMALLSMSLVLMMSLNAETEALLLMFTILSVVAWSRLPARGASGNRVPARILTGLALAGGFLLKGPLGWFFPLFGMLAWELAMPREQRRTRLSDLAWIALLAILLPLPWFLAVLRRLPTAIETWLGETVARIADDSFQVHREPWWYYLPRLALFLPPLLWAGEAFKRRLDRRALMPLIWLALGMLFLSLATSKRSHYLLSFAPAAALLPALCSRNRDRVSVWLRHSLTRLLALLLPLLLAAALWVPDRSTLLPGTALLVTATSGCLLAFLLVLNERRSLQALVTSQLLILLIGSFSLLPFIDGYRSPKAFYLEATQWIEADMPVYNWRNDRMSAAFYLGRHVPPARRADDLVQHSGETVLLLTRGKEVPHLPWPHGLIVSQFVTDPFRPERSKNWQLLRVRIPREPAAPSPPSTRQDRQ